MVKQEARQLSEVALRLMGVSMNAAGCERAFSQMSLTHTKLRNRLRPHTLISSDRSCIATGLLQTVGV